MVSYIFLCLCFFKTVVYGHYYAGVFNKNDFLVAQDNLYKERVPYRVTQSMYGRYFRCPITYYRVMDRLGMGRGPRVQLTRGGLRHKFLTLRITSPYNLPTSVTILVGCENKKVTTTKPGSTADLSGAGSSTTASGVSNPPGGDGSSSASDATDGQSGGSPATSITGVTDGQSGASPEPSNTGSTDSQSGSDSSASETGTAGTEPATTDADTTTVAVALHK